MKALVPHSPEHLGGPFVTADADQFMVLAVRGEVVLIEFHSPPGVNWFDTYVLMYCIRQREPDTIRVTRKATVEERRLYRVPLWIQDDEIPECCGRPMHFIGQIDDDRICTERPAGARVWWHDRASFYVFTCSGCLECKAVGQQF